MKTLKIDHVTVVSPEAAHAAATFERLFELRRVANDGPASGAPVSGSAVTDGLVSDGPVSGAALAIGDARIEFVNPPDGTALADALRTGGEGMAALTLIVADLDAAARALERAGTGGTR